MIEETATNQTTASTNTPQKQHVLIIGGTNFMGKELTQRLADDPAVDVHIINRQKLHWNNEWRKIQNVTFHYGDRDTHLEFIKMLKYISKKIGITEESSKKWSLVIDFCAYLRKEVKSVIRALSRRLDLYVLISTDSVYDVCDETIRHRPVKESDDIRPHLDKDVKKKAEDEDYGHDKLKCEEYLRNHVSDLRDGFPFVCLRLPDVIGPYDSTCRYWAYVIWIQQMVKKPVHTHRESREEKLSFVYSKDVATICITLLGKVRDRGWVEGVHGESFNIAFEENPTLDELVVMIVSTSLSFFSSFRFFE